MTTEQIVPTYEAVKVYITIIHYPYWTVIVGLNVRHYEPLPFYVNISVLCQSRIEVQFTSYLLMIIHFVI